MEKQGIQLPKSMEIKEDANLTFRSGEEIRSDYCMSCLKEVYCEFNGRIEYIVRGTADDKPIPTIQESFVAVKVHTPNMPFQKSINKWICTEYENPQQNLPGIFPGIHDSIDNLVKVIGKEHSNLAEVYTIRPLLLNI